MVLVGKLHVKHADRDPLHALDLAAVEVLDLDRLDRGARVEPAMLHGDPMLDLLRRRRQPDRYEQSGNNYGMGTHFVFLWLIAKQRTQMAELPFVKTAA